MLAAVGRAPMAAFVDVRRSPNRQQVGDGVDAPRRHRCAIVEVLITTRRRRPNGTACVNPAYSAELANGFCQMRRETCASSGVPAIEFVKLLIVLIAMPKTTSSAC